MSEASSTERELNELLQFLYLTPVAVVRFDREGKVEMLNPTAVQLLEDIGIHARSTDATTILDHLSPGLADAWRKSAGHFGEVVPAQHCTAERTLRGELHLQLRMVRPDERCTMLTLEDVTAVVNQERELARQRRRIGLVLEHIQGYCVAMLDRAGLVSEWNPSIGRLFGITSEAIVGTPLFRRMSAQGRLPALVPDFKTIRDAVASHGWCRLDGPWEKLGGELLWGDCVVAPVFDNDGTTSGYVAVIRDVSPEHQHTQMLLDAALTDPLTGLYNRRGLEKREEALQRRRSGAPLTQSWIMADVDYFKRVNDTHGHEAGDVVLKSVAAALRSTAREDDTVARLGGEEFMVLLPDTAIAAALQTAERLRLAVEAVLLNIAGEPVVVTASFGVAEQTPGEDRIAAIERADAALYCAKADGRNRVVPAA